MTELLAQIPGAWWGYAALAAVAAGLLWLAKRRGSGVSTADDHLDDMREEAQSEADEHEAAADDAAGGSPDDDRIDDLLRPRD